MTISEMYTDNEGHREDTRLPVAITFHGITPLNDLVYYIRDCGERVGHELEHPARCDVRASCVPHWNGDRHFAVRVDIGDRTREVVADSAENDLYVAIWRAFDVALRELVRARTSVHPVGPGPHTA